MRIQKAVFILFISIICIFTACSNQPDEPPEASTTISGKKINLSKGGYHWGKKGDFSNQMTIADTASPNQIAKELEATTVEQESVAKIVFSDNSKPQLTYQYWEGEKPGKSLAIKGNKLTLPSKIGEYIIEVDATWPNGSASYTLFINVE